jgi:hypothetical protein
LRLIPQEFNQAPNTQHPIPVRERYPFHSMRFAWIAIFALLTSLAQASRIILVPLDNRPAAGQFAQMIGDIDGAQVQMPPYELLGRYTSAGNPGAILEWLKAQDFSDVSSLVVSADMIAYGGLIASRVNNVSEAVALSRLQEFQMISQRIRPRTKVFVFSSVMRLAPTATIATRPWRAELANYVVARHRAGTPRKPTPMLKRMSATIPPGVIERYDATRKRNHIVQIALIGMTMSSFDYVIMGQDDAQIYGPHVPETKTLVSLSKKLGVDGRVYFCEGVDQNSNVLVSRALLRAANWIPRIRVVYSDPYGRAKIGAYESKNVQDTVHDQVYASGARIVGLNDPYDYTLYVNTPKRRALFFQDFLDDLRNEMDQNLPVCLADINLAADGTCDRELFEHMKAENRLMKLLAFAGWNTAGNTLGTAIPTANIMLLAQRKNFDPVKVQIAQKKFLLHRIVDDVMYHRQTRPKAYALIDSLPDGHREETYGDSYTVLTAYVRKDMTEVLNKTFLSQVKGLKFSTGAETYEFTDLQNVRIFLPWPRAYEVRVEFGLGVAPIAAPSPTPLNTVATKPPKA